MTTTALSEALAKLRQIKVPNWPAGRILGDIADEIESALASAEPVAYCDSEDPAKVANVAMGYGGYGCTVPLVFAHAQPAAKVEAPDLVLRLLIDGGFVDPAKVELAREIVASCAPTPTSDYPECSGDPASCPENDGHGCCKPNPVKTSASVPDVFREHGNSALAHISNALDDLESSPDQRPVPLLNEAMFHIREMLSPTNQEGAAP